MSEEANLTGEVIKQSKDVLGKAYDDLAHPTAKSIGNTISFLPRTIGIWLSKWEKWIINGEESIRLTAEAVKEKAKEIPEDKLTEPEPYVAVPAIQQLSYCYDSEELRELYANLLVSSMNSDTKYKVHPAFVDIIKQMTPDEAKLLKVLPRDAIAYQPLMDVQVNLGPGKGHIALLHNFSNIGRDTCECPEQINSYLENLDRLEIITILNDIHVMDEKKYDPIRKDPYFAGFLNARVGEGMSVSEKRKSFHVTNFGLSFLNTCVI